MTGLLAFDADQHIGSIAPLAISRGVRIFLPYYKLFSLTDRDQIFAAGKAAGIQVGIIPIFELGAERALAGAGAGAQDAVAIRNYMAAVAQPRGTAYILTFDFDEQTAQDPACHGYAYAVMQGVQGYWMIAYGNGALAEGLKGAGIARFAWDGGGMGMRGTRADVEAGNEDMEQDVGDVRGLHLGISIDSDFAPHANSPADLCAWMDKNFSTTPVAEPTPAVTEPAAAPSILPTLADAQTFLKTRGLYAGDVDSIWGPETAAAFAAYYGSN